MNEWINVEDKLPEKGVVIIGLFNFGKDQADYEGNVGSFRYTNKKDCLNLTHWQPLPPPPQKKVLPEKESKQAGPAKTQFNMITSD